MNELVSAKRSVASSAQPKRGEAMMSASTSASVSIARSATRTSSKSTRWLALGAVAGPVLFTLAWIILGFLSPGFTIWGTTIAPYSPISAGISGLGLGPTAPCMNAAFVLTGLLLVAGVVGVFQSIPELSSRGRWICTVLLGLQGLGAALDGIFTLESFALHLAGFLLACVSSLPGFLVAGLLLRRVERWLGFGGWLLLGSPLTLALLVLYFVTFSPTAQGATTGVAGLTERILVTEMLAWFVALGWLAYRALGVQQPLSRRQLES